jgi:deazaflavin-dependent oxidoreductase (nitroreductase family)
MAPPRRTRIERLLEKVAASGPGSWFYLNIGNPIDARLLPATGGRLSVTVGQPVLCLEVRGAKSGQIRRTPLLYMDDDGDLVVVASATGRRKHPAWYHNIRANPEVKVYAPKGRTGNYRARVAEGEERERLWKEAREFYSGFNVYERRVEGQREIPIVVLSRTT